MWHPEDSQRRLTGSTDDPLITLLFEATFFNEWGRRDLNPHDLNGQRIFILPQLSLLPGRCLARRWL